MKPIVISFLAVTALYLTISASIGYACDSANCTCAKNTECSEPSTSNLSNQKDSSSNSRAQLKTGIILDEATKDSVRSFGRHGQSAMSRKRILKDETK